MKRAKLPGSGPLKGATGILFPVQPVTHADAETTAIAVKPKQTAWEPPREPSEPQA